MKAPKSLVLAFIFGASVAATAACGKSGVSREPYHPVVRKKHASGVHPRVNNPGFPSERLAVVPEGTFGPYLGTRAEGTVMAWAAEIAGKRHWLTSGLGVQDAPPSPPKTIADAAPDVDLVAIRPLGGGTRGFVLVTTSREFSGERVDLIALGTKGELIGGPSPLAQSLPSVVWVDAVPTAPGAIAMWAVRRGDRADLYGVEVGSLGGVSEQPALLLSDISAWQVTPSGEGVAIAAVTMGKGRGEVGPLKVFFLDARGKLEPRALVVSEGGTVQPDVDLARIGDHLVLAWSDKRDGEARLYGAVVDPTGVLVKPPAPLGRPFGPQTVLRIVPPQAGGGQAYLAWENQIEQPADARAIRLAPLGADASLGEASALVQMASKESPPEFAATAKGVALLTLSPACRRHDPCAGAAAVPTFVQLDTAMDVVASEPVRLAAENAETADLAWGLNCRDFRCTTLAVSSEIPSPVYIVELGGLSNDWAPGARRVNDAPPPRAARVDTLATSSEPLAEIAATSVSAGAAVAWLTYFDPSTPFVRAKTPAPDGKYEPPRAVLRLRSIPEKGPLPEPVTLSYRADSPGGVVVVPGDPAHGTALVVWVGIDNKIPQAFATLVGPDGKKITQKMLTHAKVAVSDVAVAYTGDGWVIGYIDEGENVSEVRVTKIDPTLRVVVPERRVGSTAGTATSVQLLARGEHVFAVWSDARGARAGVADIFAVRLVAKDLTPVGPEHAVAQTPAHSRSPAIAAFGEGAVVAWVEDSSQTGERAPSTLMLARLDSGGNVVPGSSTTQPFDGSVQSVGLACGDSSCHVAAAISAGNGGSLAALVWRGGAESRVTTLVTLKAAPRDALSPIVLDRDVIYADQGARGETAVRRMNVEWE